MHKILHKKIKSDVEQVKDFVDSPSKNDIEFVTRKINVDSVVSTGSTLLDLAISGKRKRGGGIPGGVLMEIFGRSQSGKTAVMAEIMASAQSLGGSTFLEDPEGRLDEEYTRIYGLTIDKKNYTRPDTVEEIMEAVQTWNPLTPKAINVRGTDSLAALSTELEMSPKGDKMGQKRAKEFSAGFRKSARIIANNNWLWVCTNQVRQGDYGDVVPGGMATAFYASIRMKLNQVDEITRTIKLGSKEDASDSSTSKKDKKNKEDKKKDEFTKIIGIKSEAFVIKTVDDPYRKVPIYIIFGYGIDDIRGNLQYIKDMTNATVYDCTDGKTYQSLEKAISYFYTVDEETNEPIEKEDLVNQLRENTIDLWEEIEAKFNSNRSPKRR